MSGLVEIQLQECAEIQLCSPPLNLVTKQLAQELHDALSSIAHAKDVRVLVVSGSGDRAFCAGSDVGEFEDLRGRVVEGKLLFERLVYRQLATLPMPTIAAIEGFALGGGLELALCCDLRVAGESSSLGMPELRLGVIPGSGGTQRLPQVIGPARAKEMIFLGDRIDANRAEQIGLVNRVVPTGQAVAEARRMAAEIAARGPLAVRGAKTLIDMASENDLDAGLAAELDMSATLFETDDMLEGAAAFRERRHPVFRGR